MHASSVPHKVDSSADLSKQTAKRRKPPLARLFR
jgi:hypothetical protein